MNYSGHGGPNQLSHEAVVKIADFSGIESKVMPLWVTAACDILPFDGLQDNIGEAAIFNEHGGAIAFFGTTRTVYQLQNSYMNQLFTKAVLSEYNGKPVAIGEAARIAKASLAGMVTEITSGMGYADLSANKLQYTLLGDPAIKLNLPTTGMTIDSINNQTVGSGELMTLRAGDKVKVTGKSIGKGYQGRMRRWNFAGSKDTHGCEKVHRNNGSIGNNTFPGHVFKGRKMAGHWGNETVTEMGLVIVDVRPADNVILVKGSVPGPKNGLVLIRKQ